MTPVVYYVLCAILAAGVLVGISLMSKVKTSIIGNMLSAICMAGAVIVTLFYYDIFNTSSVKYAQWFIYSFMLIGLIIGLIWAKKVKMIQMPQLVALFNGFGGAASALVAIITLLGLSLINPSGKSANIYFSNITGALALAIGMITLIGSLIAAGKLHKILPQKPVIWKGHQAITTISLVLIFAIIIGSAFITPENKSLAISMIVLGTVVSGFFGVAFAIRVGGADMPVVISLLNSLSGVAGSIAGMAIGDVLLVAVGGIVGASGLLLTQIMCKSMNRKLYSILLGKTSTAGVKGAEKKEIAKELFEQPKKEVEDKKVTAGQVLKEAKKVIIVPGYGMALAQAQHLVKQLADSLMSNGVDVKYAIHPVAGRMPGHMNVLLAEADVDYDKLYQMEEINDQFKDTDVVIVVGANDVINPAAKEAEGTPIYGMPILDVDDAKNVIICNYDTKPGYAGVDNPLYERSQGVFKKLGNAAETLKELKSEYENAGKQVEETETVDQPKQDSTIIKLHEAKSAIIVPGYGMALAQAQHLVKQLADTLMSNGVDVKYAIHPVAGRMPGHMNVLLAEADVDYDKLYQMEEINDQFKDTDIVIIVGANDVVNPAAKEAEGTPIYGMPILDVDQAGHIIICNYDKQPGYAGVDNPLYDNDKKVSMVLGNAAETLKDLIDKYNSYDPNATATDTTQVKEESSETNLLKEKVQNAKSVIIVPGYGMALAQAQHLVKQVGDSFISKGADVKYAIHPVAGRMPGHMNVLLAEADVDYDKLYQMEEINDQFKNTDLVIIVGANDVVNPAAKEAEGTPIYGMPILDVDQAGYIIICNYDKQPGYAGVDNPLYENNNKVTLLLGNAAETLKDLLSLL